MMTKLFALIIPVSLFLISWISFAQSPPPAATLLKSSLNKQTTSEHGKYRSDSEKGTRQDGPIIKIPSTSEVEAKPAKQEKNEDEIASNEGWLIYSTIWLAIVTTFVAVFTGYLWRATRRLVLGAEKTAERQLRAYISVIATGKIPNSMNPRLPAYQIKIKNTGQTPAYGMKSWRGIGIHELPLVTELKPMGNVTDADPVLGSQCEAVLPIRRVTPFSSEQIASVKVGTHAIYIFGRVEYKDAFGFPHFTDFCLYEIDGGPDAGLKHTASGNNAD